MQAVILAGGLGTRLYPLTKTVPKPMVPINGVPYLEYQIRELHRQNIDDIVLLTGYLGEQIEDHFGDGSRFGMQIRYSRELTPIGTGGALRDAAALLEPLFLLIYGDSYLPLDYAAVTARLEGSSAQGLVVVYDNRREDTSVRNNIGIDSEGFVTRYDKENSEGLDYVEAGVLAFRREIVARIPAAGVVSLEKEIFPQLIGDHALVAYPTTQRFYDIGTPDRLKVIEQLFRS